MTQVDDILASFFSPQAGQARRQWLDAQTNALMYYVPPEMRPQLNAVASMTPVQAYSDSVAASRRMMDGTASPGERWQAAGDMAAGVLGIVAPGYIAGKAGAPLANALGEIVTGYGGPARNALADFGASEDGGIRLWHGSPHDFDRFDMSKIGTGEGAQAYGHGLYFAENKGVAEGYRDKLSGDVSSIGAMAVNTTRNPQEAIDAWIATSAHLPKDVQDAVTYKLGNRLGTREILDDLDIDFYGEFNDEVAKILQSYPGRLYEVNVDANPEDFLNWDAPLSEQPQKVREALGTLGYNNNVKDMWEPVPDAEYRKLLKEKYGVNSILDVPRDKWTEAQNMALRPVRAKSDMTGQSIIEDMAGGDANYSEDVSPKLRQAGIPGIRYFDAGSRGAGDGSRNYVVFDDNLITILKKYGALPASFVAGAAMQPGQAQAGPATPPRAEMGATGRW